MSIRNTQTAAVHRIPLVFLRVFPRVSVQAAFASLLLLLSTSGAAGELKVVELFTSQGCYSCPAADKLISELAAKDADILNLELHVDYWNDLQYRSEGNWEDPYSSAEYSLRQQLYAIANLEGRNGVYTPQAVINGVYGTVGSNSRAMKNGLSKEYAMPVTVTVERENAHTLNVSLATVKDVDAHVYFVRFLKKVSTNITSGENHDKVMENHNVVLEMKPIAKLARNSIEPVQVAFAGGENLDCAVLVQSASQGAMLGAARCP